MIRPRHRIDATSGRRGPRALVVLLRAALLALPLLLVGLLPGVVSVASAATADDLPGHTSTFTVVDGILVFGAAPIGVFLLVALLVMRPGTAPKAQRYRPGRDWSAAPSWSGLHPAAEAPMGAPALPAADTIVPVMDGAPVAEHADSTTAAGGSGTIEGELADDARGTEPGNGLGGARGSW